MARPLFTTFAAGAAGLALSGCVILDIDESPAAQGSAPQPDPARAAASADSFDGPGADWRALAERELADRLNRPRREGQARNVILFIADGMDIGTITAARILDGQNRGMSGEENYLSFERWGHSALIKTYNENAQVPDSAGTATALHTGVKSHIGAISVYPRQTLSACGPDADVPATTLERAMDRGLSAGVISTARLTHATPATAYAHVPDRGWENDARLPAEAVEAGCRDIAAQLVDTWSAEHGAVDIALGGGLGSFLPQDAGGLRRDGRDLTEEWDQLGGEFVADASEFRALDVNGEAPVLGLFTRSHLSYEHDRDEAEEPSLAEMTEFAIRRLSQDEDGFYLMVEAGRVDHAHHGTNAYRALTDALAFARAVETAERLTDPDETLIIVTADHGHVFNIAGYPRRGNPILGLVHPPAPDLSDAETPPAPAQDGRPYTTLGYYNGPVQRHPDGEALTQEEVTDPDYRQQSAVPMGSETHSGEDIAAYALGPWAHLVDGTMEQHTLGRIITYAYGWDAVDEAE